MRIQASPRAVFRWLCAVICFLLIANFAAHMVWIYSDQGFLNWAASLFNVNVEKNFPSAFSSLNLFFSSCLLYLIGRRGTHAAVPASFWYLVAAVFLFLSIDEFVSVHEMLVRPTQRLIGSSTGIFRFAWVLPYAALLGVFILLVFPSYWRLPPRTRAYFTVAGVLFVVGAVGAETLGGIYLGDGEPNPLVVMVLTMTEEGLEMFGIALFNYSLLDYITTHVGGLQMILSTDAEDAGE